MSRAFDRVCVLTVMIGLAGWSATATDQAPRTRERLALRIDSFWKAWQSQDLHAIYLIYAPSYRKATPEATFVQTYRAITGLTPISYKLGKIEPSEDASHATVTLEATILVPGFGANPTKLVQRWAYEQEDWYRLTDPPMMPVPAAPPPSTPSADGGAASQFQQIPAESSSAPPKAATPSPTPRPR